MDERRIIMSLEKIGASDGGDRWAEFMKTEVGRDVQLKQRDALSDDDTRDIIEMVNNSRDETLDGRYENTYITKIDKDGPDTPDNFKLTLTEDREQNVEDDRPYFYPMPDPDPPRVGDPGRFDKKPVPEKAERHEKKKDEVYRKIGKSVVALMIATGVFMGGVFAQNGIDKGMRQSDYNEAMKNCICATYDTTATMETTPQDVYQNIEHDFMADRAEGIYDNKHGEGAFDELVEKDADRGAVQQEALTDATYGYYDKENPKSPDRFSPDTRKWAKEEIGGETTLDKIKSWFD